MGTKRVNVGPSTRVKDGKTQQVKAHTREVEVPESPVVSKDVAQTSETSASSDPLQPRRPPIRPEQRQEIVRQIGRMNLGAISGGRVTPREHGVDLPVARGYHVTVDLEPNDTYTVQRVFRRGQKEWVKGELSNVYFDEVGEQAYRASCYHHEWKNGELE